MKEDTIKLIKLLVEIDDSMSPCELERIAGLLEPKAIGTFGIYGLAPLRDLAMEAQRRDELQRVYLTSTHRIKAIVKVTPASRSGIDHHCCCCRC